MKKKERDEDDELRLAEECWEGTRDIFSSPPAIVHNKIRDFALDSGSLINNPRRFSLSL